jgi:hypothetical protein
MYNTKQDRREKQLRRYLKAHDKTYNLPSDQEKKVQAELGKQYKADIEDLHSAIRMTCSKRGPSDNSRAAYRHEVNQTKERLLKKHERKELLDELEEPILQEQRNGATIP